MMSYLQESDTSSACHQIIFSTFQDDEGADFVICNSGDELEPNTISALQRKKLFYAKGPTFPQGFKKSSVTTSQWFESDCTHWLNTKLEGSVLYILFGSYVLVKRKHLIEIANGLLLSKVNFVWVLRPDIVSSDDVDPLPKGNREDLGDHAMIIPVLNHPAIRGFLTHCRWNSMIESVWSEVPLLCFPMLTDQFNNGKLAVEEWRSGLNLSEKNRVTAEEVSNKISCLMSESRGTEYKSTVRELKKKLEDVLMPRGSSQRNLDKFFEDLEEQIRGRSTIKTEHQTM